jgi:hypothetical protein
VSQEEPKAYRELVQILLGDPSVSEGQMMGMPALKFASKMFGGLFEGELVLKLGRERVDELVSSGRAAAFDPSGRDRPMRDWARLPEPTSDWLNLAREALAPLVGD